MDEIYLVIVGGPGHLVAIAVLAVIVVALGLRLLSDRRRKVAESRRSYNCLTAKMAWGSSDNPVDSRAQQLLADRAARRAAAAAVHHET